MNSSLAGRDSVFGKYLEKAERIIRRIRVPRCDVPFVVLFQERSGSSHFCSILGNHYQVVCRQENFYEVPIDTPESGSVRFGHRSYRRELTPFSGKVVSYPSSRRITAHFHDIFSCPVKASGFKFKYPLQPILFPEIVQELKRFGSDLRIIALTRKNILRQSISRQNMLRMRTVDENCRVSHANLWKHNAPERIEFPFQLDIQPTVEYANELLRQQSGFAELVEQFRSSASVLDLVYEDLLANQSAVIRRAFEFLQVDPEATIYSSVTKATPDNLAETVSNLGELKEAIGGTDLEAFLD